jgi:hypothetical protein
MAPRLSPTFLALLVCLSAATRVVMAQVQDPHNAQPERPTVATHAGTVAPGWLEVEFGGEFDRYGSSDYGGGVPLVAKFGLTSRVQLSVYGSAVSPRGGNTVGLGDVAVGVKWRILDHSPVLGRFAVLPSVKFPTGSATSGAGTGTTDVSVLLISSRELGPVELDINAGYTRRSGTGDTAPRDATLWTFAFGGPVIGGLGWTAEIYGYPRTAGPAGQASTVAVLAGPMVTLRRYLTMDGGVIVPVAGGQPRAVYAGGVWNIGRLW